MPFLGKNISKSFNLIRLAGAVLGGLAVVSGAASAHGSLHDYIAAQNGLDYWQKALTYQWYHALALVAVSSDWNTEFHFSSHTAPDGMSGGSLVRTGLPLYALCWIAGVFCFSGSLYVLALAPGTFWIAPLTPIGGLLMICGWVLLAWNSRRSI